MMPGIARAASNHFRAAAAIRAALIGGALLGAHPATGQVAPSVGAEVSADPFVQRGVPAEATAENAVVARERALASGQRLAYERMASQLGLPARLADSQIDGLVQSLVIESERVTSTRYIARITVNFSQSRVAALGGGAAPAAPAPGFAGQTPAAPRPGQAVVVVDAVAQYRSFPEWVEITRRMNASGVVARLDVVSIAPDMARLRLGLASDAPSAVQSLARSGLLLTPAQPPARTGEGWRLDLAGRR